MRLICAISVGVNMDFTLGKQFMTRVEVQTTIRTIGPYGSESGQRFEATGNKLLYASGRAGPMIDNIALYFDTCL